MTGLCPVSMKPKTPDIEHYVEAQMSRVAGQYLGLRVGKHLIELFSMLNS